MNQTSENPSVIQSVGPSPFADIPVRYVDTPWLFQGEFSRIGNHLLIEGPNGEQLLIEDYFSGPAAKLILPNGTGMTPDMVTNLIRSDFQETQIAGPEDAVRSDGSGLEVIGKVKFSLGKVKAVSKDGVERAIKRGDEVFEGDEIRTAKNGMVKIELTEGTKFQLGKNARATLDKLDYSPEDGQGEFGATVLTGAFRYVSGKIADVNPGQQHTQISTPTATMGIRGSELDGEVDSNGQTTVIHRSGVLEISQINGTETFSVTLTQTGQSTVVKLDGVSPIQPATPEMMQRITAQLPPRNATAQEQEEEQAAKEAEEAAAKQQAATEGKDAEGGENGEGSGEGEGEESEEGDSEAEEGEGGEESAEAESSDGEGGDDAPAPAANRPPPVPAQVAEKLGQQGDKPPPRGRPTKRDVEKAKDAIAEEKPEIDLNEAPRFLGNSNFSIGENVQRGTFVANIQATDGDNSIPDSGVAYSILFGNINDAFVINADTGIIRVNNRFALDFEVIPTFNLVVQADDGNSSSVTLITINLVDINEPPVFFGNNSFTLAEHNNAIGDVNVLNGTLVGDVNATNGDEGGIDSGLTYNIINGNTDNAFVINSETGVIRVANGLALDFETNPQFELVIQASDGVRTTDTIVTINLQDINEPPVFLGDNTSFILEENSPAETLIGDINADNGDGGEVDTGLSYSIIAGNIGNAFSIDSDTGVLRVADSTALDFEANPQFTLVIQADDGVRTTNREISVNLSDVIEAPIFVGDNSFNVAENSAAGTIVGDVDADNGDNDPVDVGVSYSIIAGNIDNNFVIDSDTGVIRVANGASLDFESTPTFTLTVRADDGEFTTDQQVTVNLQDINEQPVFTATGPFSVVENTGNGAIVGNIDAGDGDVGLSDIGVTYSIIGGNLNDAFRIDANTGLIRVNNSAALDFESTPVFNLTVRADDGETSSVSDVQINLDNILEPGSLTPPATVQVSEDSTLDLSGLRLNEDSGNTTVIELSVQNGLLNVGAPEGVLVEPLDAVAAAVGDDAAGFRAVRLTGTAEDLKVALAQTQYQPDADYAGDDVLRVRIDNGIGITNQSIDIQVVNQQDAPTVVDESATIGENAAFSINVLENDSDLDGDDTLFIASVDATSQAGVVLQFDAATNLTTYTPGSTFDSLAAGEITQDSYTYRISDDKGNISQGTVNITIVGNNDAPTGVNDIGSLTADRIATFDVLANDTDIDNGDAANLVLTAVNPPALGSAVIVDNQIAYDPGSAFAALRIGETAEQTLTYTFQDSDGLQSTATLTLTIIGVNDGPQIVTEPETLTALDGGAVDTDLSTFFRDPDGDVLVFSASGLPEGVTLSEDGVLSGTLNSDASQNGDGGSYLINVTATDTQGETVSVGLTLNAINQAPIALADTGTTAEDLTLVREAANGLLSNDFDRAPDNDVLSISSVADAAANVGRPVTGSQGGLFTINADGSVSFDPNGDFDFLPPGETTSTSINYVVSDGQGGTANSSYTVTVTGRNSIPVATDDVASTNEGGNVVTGNVLLNDFPIDNDDNITLNSVDGSSANIGTTQAGSQGGTFIINADGSYSFDPTGIGPLAAGEALNTSISYSIIDTRGEVSSATLTATVNGVNDQPFFTNEIGEVSLVENSPRGTVVADINADDGDGAATDQNISYSILSGNIGNAFTINTNGIVSVNTESAIDFETNPVFDLQIQITDDGGLQATQNLNITLADANDRPKATNLFQTQTYNRLDSTIELNDIVVSDQDAGEIITATLTLSTTQFGNLTVNSDNGETYDAETGVWTITGSLDSVNAALADVRIDLNEAPFSDFTISVSIADGGEDGAPPRAGRITLDEQGIDLINLSSLRPDAGNNGESGTIFEFVAGSGLNTPFTGPSDINGDGFDDVILGAPGTPEGQSFVLSGARIDTALINPDDSSASFFSISGDIEGNDLIGSVITAGDFNGDGRADLAIGAPREGEPGRLFIINGEETGIGLQVGNETPFLSSTIATFPSALASGDFNGDGIDDLLVGSAENPTGTGVTTLFLGQTDGILAAAGTFTGPDNVKFGSDVSSAGDFNGDGFDDILIASPGDDNVGGTVARIYYGGLNVSGVATGAAKLSITSNIELDLAGTSISGIGDVNNDGFDDIIIGAPGNTNTVGVSTAGSAYVIYGGQDAAGTLDLGNLNSDQGFKITGLRGDGVERGDSLGSKVSAAGDVNGDGYDDFLISAPGYDGIEVQDSGATYVILGDTKAELGKGIGLSAIEQQISDRGFIILGENGNDRAGTTVNAAGDVNGDGYDDLLVSSLNANSGDGTSYLIYGRDFTEDTREEGTPEDDAITGSFRSDILLGGAGNDDIRGGGGNDSIRGGAGDDDLRGDRGDDLLHGGNGNDTAAFSDATSGVSVSLGYKAGGELGFNGNNSVATSAPLSNTPGDSFTLEFWATNTAAGGTFLSIAVPPVEVDPEIDPEAVPVPGRELLITADQLVVSNGTFTDTFSFGEDGQEELNNGTPHHVALVFGLSSITLYIDGQEREIFETEVTASSDLFEDGAILQLGQGQGIVESDPAATTLNGSLDELRLWNGERSLEQIQDNLHFSIEPQADLRAYYRFDNASGLSTDSSGNSNTLQTLANVGSQVSSALVNDVSDAPQSVGGGLGIDTLRDIENLKGSDFGDILVGDSGNNILIGGRGDDQLRGGAGIDTADYRDESSAIEVNLTRNEVIVPVRGETDRLLDIEIINGTAFSDIFTADNRVNRLNGFGGRDLFIINELNEEDVIDGGDDIDTVDYSGVTSDGVVVAIDTAPTSNDFPQKLANIEIIFGTEMGDVILGENPELTEDKSFFGRGGDDVLRSGLSNDLLDGGSGDDVLESGTGNDTLIGGDGNDVLNTEAGDNILQGGNGEDILNAGDGSDGLEGGSEDDVLNAGAGNDTLIGGSGADTLNGDEGNDFLDGDLGNIQGFADVLNGGEGDDILIYDRLDILNGDAGVDTLQIVETGSYTEEDFRQSSSIEKIDLGTDDGETTLTLDFLNGALSFSDGSEPIVILGNAEDGDTAALLNGVESESGLQLQASGVSSPFEEGGLFNFYTLGLEQDIYIQVGIDRTVTPPPLG